MAEGGMVLNHPIEDAIDIFDGHIHHLLGAVISTTYRRSTCGTLQCGF